MNISQVQLLSLLKLAIHGGVPQYELFSYINEDELFHLALQQDVYPFLYPILNKYCNELKLDVQIMRRWKETTLYMAARQVLMMSDIETIINLFESNAIPVISLKGLVLKQLYPHPELRNMGDIDLLIHEKNISRAIELLSIHGYHPSSTDLNNRRYMHISMKKSGSFSVELHRTLWHQTIMKNKDIQRWLDHIWQNKRIIKMDGFQFFALSLEDELINLVVHLARHIMFSFANLRQLCDFVLFVKTYWRIMDFKYIEQTIKSMDLFSFYQNLLSTCSLHLGLEIPINNILIEDAKYNVLVDLIYSSNINHQKKEQNISLSQLKSCNTTYDKFFIPIIYVWKLSLKFTCKIKIIFKNIPFVTRTVEFFKRYKTKAQYLRSIGLYIKY